MVISIGLLAYFLGKRSASRVVDNIVMNNVLIKQIAELSSLEVRGNATIKSSNISNDGSLADSFKKLFLERSFNISVPYTAKYGIDLGRQNINVKEKAKEVYIVLPDPQLLSYELRMDQSLAVSKKGLLETADEETYNRLMQKLYAQSRTQLENNETYRRQSKQKIKKIIEDYYAPLQYKVHITFKDEIKSKVLEQDSLF